MKYRVILIVPLAMNTNMLGATLGLPYGALYLAEELIRNEYSVKILQDSNQVILDKLDEVVGDCTLCIGISTMSGTQLKNAIDIATEIRKRYPNIKLVWGGVHVTALAEQALQSSLVDILIWGEGESTFPLVVNAIKNKQLDSLKNVPGIGIKIDGISYLGSNSGFTKLSDRIFNIPYYLLDMKRYSRKLAIGVDREYQIWTSRGCPYRCNFCSNSSKVWPNTTMRQHSIEHIVNDVSILYHKYHADCITFADEGFLQNEERFLKILSAIHTENISVKYRFSARIDILLRLKESTWEKFKEFGVIGITTAPESGSQRILDDMGKRITIEQILELNSILTKYGFFKGFNFLIGTPKESIGDFIDTLRLITILAESSKYCPYPLGALHKYIPLVGTAMFEDSIKRGFVPPTRFEEWGAFDFEDVRETRKSVRPWISDEVFDILEAGTKIVEELNNSFQGEASDVILIDNSLIKLHQFINKHMEK